jgi:Zn-dependent protease
MGAITPQALLAWAAFGYLLLRGLRYLLGARLYLTSALREVRLRPVSREQIDPGELRLLRLLDAELATAGFRHLGFGQITPMLTHYGAPLPMSIYMNEKLPGYAFVRRHWAPEYGLLVELEIRTDLGEREQMVTLNTPFSGAGAPPEMRIEGYPGLSVSELVERHKARLSMEPTTGTAEEANLERLFHRVEADVRAVRAFYRARKWTVSTRDPALDRFTLRGAFALTHNSQKLFGARPPPRTTQAVAASILPPISFEEQRTLRIEADLHDTLQVAEYPQAAPGIPWPLLTAIMLTALVSFAAMTWLWNAYVAALILAAVTLHEAGHAFAMRALGYRDVHVFFIPLLGAMTVGRPVATSVRNRLLVLLAGPLPGLWLAVLLLVIEHVCGPMRLLHISALTLLILNGLNLLPFTPLDGGRALEALSRPESAWRWGVHAASAAGLLGLAAYTRDPLLTVLGVVWIALLPQQLLSHRLRRAVAAEVSDRTDFRSVVRATLEIMTMPRYARIRAPTRQITARTIARLFAESTATSGDRIWGAIAYAAAWIPVIAAAMLWSRPG